MWVEGECSWCRQCGRDGVREERVRGRRDGYQRGLDRYGKGRYGSWGS